MSYKHQSSQKLISKSLSPYVGSRHSFKTHNSTLIFFISANFLELESTFSSADGVCWPCLSVVLVISADAAIRLSLDVSQRNFTLSQQKVVTNQYLFTKVVVDSPCVRRLVFGAKAYQDYCLSLFCLFVVRGLMCQGCSSSRHTGRVGEKLYM